MDTVTNAETPASIPPACGHPGRARFFLMPKIKIRVSGAEKQKAEDAARTIIESGDHQSQADKIVALLRNHAPQTLANAARVICGLRPVLSAPQSRSDGDVAREDFIRVSLRDAEKPQVEEWLKTVLLGGILASRRSIADAACDKARADIAAQLEALATHLAGANSDKVSCAAQFIRAVWGLPPTRVGAPLGSKNAAKKPQKGRKR